MSNRPKPHPPELQSPAHFLCRLLPASVARTVPTAVPPAEFSSTDIAAELVIDGVLSLTSFRLTFFFNDTATTEIYTLALHDALPILGVVSRSRAAPL